MQNRLRIDLDALKDRACGGGYLMERRWRQRHNDLDAANADRRVAPTYWAERALAQTEYCLLLAEHDESLDRNALEAGLGLLSARLKAEGAITKAAVKEIEETLSGFAGAARSLTMLCVGHAHIDMNWKWSWPETVACTLDTLRTVLNLMAEYPEFTFGQSQAAVYRIVEEYEPELLDGIRHYVKEGRWEVTASQWVEGDKNMPNGESLARHILYSKRYLSDLLGIPADDIRVCFEPDTFGHGANVPEVLADGGGPWMYHCRGWDGPLLHRWQAASGRSVLVCREGRWYNSCNEGAMILAAPQFRQRTGRDTMLAVYGVGDHGGGPTRRDLDTLRYLATWPLAPRIEHTTYCRFFETIEQTDRELPVVDHELNIKFAGCFSSQSRIKAANRRSEDALFEAELYRTWAASAGLIDYRSEPLEAAWRDVLFSQFHDILPGTGVEETYQYALGRFQDTVATALTQKSQALRAIADAVDTSSFAGAEAEEGSMAEGAGAGAGLDQLVVSPICRGRGSRRAFVVFNPLPFPRSEPVEITLWDWAPGAGRVRFVDADGDELHTQGIGAFDNQHGHTRQRFLVQINVPACGHAICVAEDPGFRTPPGKIRWTSGNMFGGNQQIDRPTEYVLENDHVRAEFDPADGAVISMVHKATGNELIAPEGTGARFRLLAEDPASDAWRTHRIMQTSELRDNVLIRGLGRDPNALRQGLQLDVPFGERSRLSVGISLPCDAAALELECRIDWREFGSPDTLVPQLNFAVPLCYCPAEFVTDTAFGYVGRPGMAMDVPGVSWILARNEGAPSVAIFADSRCGFRGDGNVVWMPLIRGTYKPDPYAEIGSHRLRFRLAALDAADPCATIMECRRFVHPLTAVSTGIHPGTLQPTGSFLQISGGSVALSAVKVAEDGNDLIIRLYETDGTDTTAELLMAHKIARAELVTVNETPCGGSTPLIDGRTVRVTVPAYRVVTLRLEVADD